jgi:UDP-N-acetylmuramoyl-L-alanyl-D-glutamate--2,6-diaminopimelate ligase
MIVEAQRPTSVVDSLDSIDALIRALDTLPTRIEHATASSREARAGSLFLAYPGATRDGRHFIADAIARGVSAVAYEVDPVGGTGVAGSGSEAAESAAAPRIAGAFEWNSEWKVPSLAVRDLKRFASHIGAHVYQHPSNSLWMVGVTGTNGKTSVSQWVARALQAAGKPSAVMGTIGNGLVEDLQPSDNTTPDALVLQRELRRYVDAGASACAMEVSSHGLDQGRVADVKYDVAVFTNLSRDHLDYHGTMDVYAEAKAKLFTLRGLKAAVVNVDDAFGRELAERCAARGVEVVRYAINGGRKYANLSAHDIAVTTAGLSFTVKSDSHGAGTTSAVVETDILGAFNASNLLAVIGVLLASGISLPQAAKIVATLPAVNGRMQTVRAAEHATGKPLVVVDYAHSPDALEKALMTVAAIVPEGGRLICTFGCGGDRDRGKRPQMGAIAARYADVVIVTSDNPRAEDAARIVADIEAGMQGFTHRAVLDRQQAIFEALNLAHARDVVLIAGKGHEDYQIIGETKHHFSDVEVARDALAVWKGAA